MRLLFPLVCATLALAQSRKREYSTHDYYVLEHRSDDPNTHHLDTIRSIGGEYVEPVGQLRDHHLIRVPKSHPKLTRSLAPRAIRSLDLQIPKQRTKRWLDLERAPPPPVDQPKPEDDPHYHHVVDALSIGDPGFRNQWHLLNTKNPSHDMNVSGAWEMGYTGKGVIAAIVDDGLDFHSDDLAANYVSPPQSPSPPADPLLTVGRRLMGLQRPRPRSPPQTRRRSARHTLLRRDRGREEQRLRPRRRVRGQDLWSPNPLWGHHRRGRSRLPQLRVRQDVHLLVLLGSPG